MTERFLSTGASENIEFYNQKQKYKEENLNSSLARISTVVPLTLEGKKSLALNESSGSITGT